MSDTVTWGAAKLTTKTFIERGESIPDCGADAFLGATSGTIYSTLLVDEDVAPEDLWSLHRIQGD